MKQLLLNFLLYCYHNITKSNRLRKSIKKVIGSSKIVIPFNGFKINVGTNSAIESNLIFDSYNEFNILKLIKKFSADGYNFIDIGANIGVHSLTAASANDTIEIFSFEPESNNFKHFIDNISLNSYQNIRPFKMGLGNSKVVSVLNINEGWNKGRHSLKVDFQGSTKKLKIPITTLDSFIDVIDTHQIIFKIDVEGFEKEVLQGAKSILQKAEKSMLIIELVSEINEVETCKEIIDTLKSHGFQKIYKMDLNNTMIAVDGFNGSADYVCFKGILNTDRLEI
jgi:FkbM family methyltransferase